VLSLSCLGESLPQALRGAGGGGTKAARLLLPCMHATFSVGNATLVVANVLYIKSPHYPSQIVAPCPKADPGRHLLLTGLGVCVRH